MIYILISDMSHLYQINSGTVTSIMILISDILKWYIVIAMKLIAYGNTSFLLLMFSDNVNIISILV